MRGIPSAIAAAVVCWPALLNAQQTADGPLAHYGHFGVHRPQVQVRAIGLPRLGDSFQLEVNGSGDWLGWHYRYYLISGWSNRSYGPLPLPFDTSVLSSPDATWTGELLVSIDSFEQTPLVDPPGAPVRLSITIPNDPTLLGLRFYHQLLNITIVPTRPPRIYLVLSQGGEAIIGY